MNRAAIIRTPLPSLEETADALGLSRAHAKQVESFAKTLVRRRTGQLTRRSNGGEAGVRHGSSKAQRYTIATAVKRTVKRAAKKK